MQFNNREFGDFIMDCITNLKEIQKMELDMLIEMDRVCRENDLTYSLAFGTVLGAVRHKGFIPWDDDIDIMVDIDHYKSFCKVLQDKLSNKYFVYSYETNSGYEYLFSRIGLLNKTHLDFHIDIFPMVGTPKSMLGRKIFSKVAYLIYRCYFVKKINVNINHKNKPNKKKLALLLKIILFVFPAKLFIWLYEKLSKAFPIDKSNYLYNFCGLYKYKEIIPKSYLNDLIYMEFENNPFPVPKEWDPYLRHMYGDYLTPKMSNYV